MPIYEITPDHLHKIEETSFSAAGVRERADLQRLLRNQVDVIAPETLVIAEEFGEWEDSRRRIDLLALDRDANLVVIELKRTEDGGHMDLQALRYAAMVSTMTFDKAVEVYANHLAQIDTEKDARHALLEFLDWEEPDEDHFAQDVRIVLVSAEFSKELTTAVLWLNERDLDIRCVRLKPYNDNGRTLVDVQQVIPLPEATEYQVQVSAKSRKERIARASTKDFTKFDVTVNGATATHLAKRNAIFFVVKSLCDGGTRPEKIADLIHWRTRRLFLAHDGQLVPTDFITAAATRRGADGKRFEQRRWFCDEGELIYCDNKTFAFSNQWGDKWSLAMNILIEAFPEAQITYQAAESE
ncbi:hypothetical protein ARNL5_02817 [Anaerolineae bacterium]|nr:hypothetical protein ARNL5_02817 [Anaerolineae bacterium]